MGVEEIFRLVLLIGSVMIFIMSFILWFHPKGLFPNRVLGLLIFAWGYGVFIFAVQSRAFFISYPHLFGVGTALIFLFFPLMFMYIKTYLFKKYRKVSNLLIHLIPFFIFSISLSSFYFQSAANKADLIANGLPQWVRDIFYYGNIAIISLGVLYTILSFRIIDKFEHHSKIKLSKFQTKAIHWLKQFLIINAVLWAIGTSGVFIEMLGVDIPFDLFRVYYLGLTILTLWMSVFTIYKPDLFYATGGESEFDFKRIIRIKKSDKNKLINVSDDKRDAKIIINHLESEKPYLNSEMTLQNLADGSGMSKHRVSELLNIEIGLSFSEVINEYRIKEVIRLINDGVHEQHKILHLAELSGFNSKATFNRIFKKKTGKTPSQYIQDITG